MNVLAVHADVIVFISRIWQTTCTAVRGSDEGFVIDSPVYPDELDAVAPVLEQAGFPVSGILATHGDWDHLLGRLAFPNATLGCGETTAQRLRFESGAALRKLRRFDEEHYVERAQPLALVGMQPLPIPGQLSIGRSRELQLHPAAGHTADGMAIVIPWAGVLVCGDYLSPVEIPMVSEGGSVQSYLETLGHLGRLIERVDTVVPGHGTPLSADEAARVLEEDVRYLETLERDAASAELPASRRTAWQRHIHSENRARLR